jgi:hypothetical protein
MPHRRNKLLSSLKRKILFSILLFFFLVLVGLILQKNSVHAQSCEVNCDGYEDGICENGSWTPGCYPITMGSCPSGTCCYVSIPFVGFCAPLPTAPPQTCDCGSQQCNTTPGCGCYVIGCRVGSISGPTCIAYTCGGGGGCSATRPTNLALTKISSSTWQLTWTKGSGGTSQRVYVGTNKANVENNCASAGCIVKDEAVNINTQSYNIDNLSAGTIYYARVVTYESSSCLSASWTLTSLSSCDTDQPSLTLPVGGTSTLTTLVASSAEIGSVTYTKSGAFINVNPASDNSYIYSTDITGISVGSGTVTSAVKNPGGTTMCTAISNVTVSAAGPWWQVIDGDVSTNGDLYYIKY